MTYTNHISQHNHWNHWLQWNLSFRQFPIQTVTKLSLKWHLCFSEKLCVLLTEVTPEITSHYTQFIYHSNRLVEETATRGIPSLSAGKFRGFIARSLGWLPCKRRFSYHPLRSRHISQCLDAWDVRLVLWNWFGIWLEVSRFPAIEIEGGIGVGWHVRTGRSFMGCVWCLTKFSNHLLTKNAKQLCSCPLHLHIPTT